MIKEDQFWQWVDVNRGRILRVLAQYLAVDTTSPNEWKAFPYLHDYLREVGFSTWEESMQEAVFSHKDACPSPPSKIDSRSKNFRGSCRPMEANSTVLVSCHIDVVPASNWPEAFAPHIDDSGIVGRGACDTKGNLVMMVEAIRFLNEMQIGLAKNIEFDGVIEEEIGGNGALSTVLHGEVQVDGVIVLEPTSLKCYRGHRGCLGFSIDITGSSTHMAAATATSPMGPVQAMCRLVDELVRIEKMFLEEALQEPAFVPWARPIQVNVGRIEGGEWHGSTVDACRIMVNMGFPPGREINQVESYLKTVVKKLEDASSLHHSINFDGIRNGAYLCDPETQFIKGFVDAMAATGSSQEAVYAWNASCDARTYSKHLSVPTVIFGAGHLSDAHSNHERLDFLELAKGIYVLASYFSCSQKSQRAM